MHKQRSRMAFTLVELLVVIAIIGVLIALLLPAVQAAREAARRMQCSNNLKQLALGVHNHHDTKQIFPPGGVTNGNCCGTRSGTNWAIEILPYCEMETLYDQYDQNAFNEDAQNQFVREQEVEFHQCPSDPFNKLLERPASGPGSGLNYRHGSYRCVAGRSNGSGWWDNSQHTALPTNWRGPLSTVNENTGGIVREATRFRDITDGTSNTFLIGEYATRTRSRRGTFWAYTYTSYNSSDTHDQPRTLINDYDRCVAIGGAGGSNSCKRGWGSFHPTGLLFANCDGSVAFVPETIDPIVFAGKGAMGDGERLQ